MSKIKVGDKVKVRNIGRGTDGWVGDVVCVGKKFFSVRFKNGDNVLYFHEDELEFIPAIKTATPPPQTKMLHELIILAKAGVKFSAKLPHAAPQYNSSGFFLEHKEWHVDEITTPWQYEEIKEPRVVEFEAIPSKETNQYAKIWAKELLPLKGVKCRVVVTEVIDE